MTDVELGLLDWARARWPDPNTRVTSERPANFTRMIFLNRTGGPARFVLDHPSLTFETFDVTRQLARALACEVTLALRTELRGHSLGDGIVTDVSVGSGPFWLPWENTNVRRFGIAAQLTIR